MGLDIKDTGMGLRAVDKIVERYGLQGVYGPLYRLFEVEDQRYNTAVELTAGNRYARPSFYRGLDILSSPFLVYSM